MLRPGRREKTHRRTHAVLVGGQEAVVNLHTPHGKASLAGYTGEQEGLLVAVLGLALGLLLRG